MCECFAFVQRFFGSLGMQVALVPLNVARAPPVCDPDLGAAVKTLGFHIKVISLEFVLGVVFLFVADRACKKIRKTFSISVYVCVNGIINSIYDVGWTRGTAAACTHR